MGAFGLWTSSTSTPAGLAKGWSVAERATFVLAPGPGPRRARRAAREPRIGGRAASTRHRSPTRAGRWRASRAASAGPGSASTWRRSSGSPARTAGTGPSGSAGERATAEYVAGRLRAAGYRVTVEEVAVPAFASAREPRLTAGSRSYAVRTLQFSGSGSVTGTVRAVGARLLSSERSRPLRRGEVALIQRGTCPFRAEGARGAARRGRGGADRRRRAGARLAAAHRRPRSGARRRRGRRGAGRSARPRRRRRDSPRTGAPRA